MSKSSVALGAPVDFTYRFDVAPDAKFDGDYKVLVHVEDADGMQMWTDDHDPPIPTSQWKPGQHIEETRTRFIPAFLSLGDVVVRAGLYRGNTRLRLTNPDAKQRAYKVGTINLRPQSDNVFLQMKSGWHQTEVAAGDPADEWQWTEQSGLLSFPNPKRNSTFYLEYSCRADLFDRPQQVTVWAGTQQIGSFAATSALPALIRIPVPAAALGTGDLAEIHIDVDRSFVPAKIPAANSHDARVLGLRVYHVYLEPQ